MTPTKGVDVENFGSPRQGGGREREREKMEREISDVMQQSKGIDSISVVSQRQMFLHNSFDFSDSTITLIGNN